MATDGQTRNALPYAVARRIARVAFDSPRGHLETRFAEWLVTVAERSHSSASQASALAAAQAAVAHYYREDQ